ncbi:hypothetical protein OV090_06405 [Nannocystis sp. RBIL2]|uniref:hypothetical protein n=1 Tax=Nannocystis sp. RBIL2 TaxID=2996788 RepID=UPI0022713E93|nr:hypothetical protein [Nannocystis sp. RBIL2]MCY1064382.1 hypothetical protein [Nannocystis sp. RBIL2]
MSDPSRIPARVLELLASVTGHGLSLHAASAAAGSVALDPEDWLQSTARAARQAGLKAARFTVDTAEELRRLCALESPACSRVGDRWLVLLGARRGVLDLVIVDELGEERRPMRAAGLIRWLAGHGAVRPMPWLAIEPRFMFSALSFAPTEMVRLIRTFVLERREIAVVVVYGVAMAVASLAVPIAAQALVNTIAADAMVQPIAVLSVLLLIALGAVALLRVLQLTVVERVHRRLWVRGVTDWIRRTPRTSRASRQATSNRELANRFLDVATLQKDVAALLLDGTSLVLVTTASLVLLGCYHPLLLAFDAALVVGIAVVLLAGLGAQSRAVRESGCKWALFAWMDDVASTRLLFADPRGRALADQRGELLLRDWLHARGNYFQTLLRHVVAGVGLEALATVAVLGLGGWLVVSGELALGQLVAASVLVGQIGSGVGRLGRQLDPVYEGVAAVATMGKTLDAPLEAGGGAVLPRASRPLGVELLDGEGAPIVALRPGERLALVGGSDSHSRALDLLFGLYGHEPLPRLRARLDGFETHALELDSVREQVALVRGGELVRASLLENLVGTATASDRGELFALLDLVDLRHTVLDRPGGLQRELLPDNDDGPLRDSEIRRLALVRALLARPRLLLIDLGLDRLGLSPTRRGELLDWIVDPRRPWTLVVVTDSVDSGDVLSRCHHQRVLADC